MRSGGDEAESEAIAEDSKKIAERYVLEGALGEGGMGAIYRAFDTITGTRVALKQLKVPSDGAADTWTALFQREFQTLQQLTHPRIIRVFDYGLAEQGPYYTMELLDGQDMRELAPLEPMRACALLRDVASSLAIVHSRGLVYRDLSQRNVRCTTDGRAKLLDFGALMPMGVPRHIVGTPAFTPPEAMYGQPLDQRADLFALGVLAYWLLTGRMPFLVRDLRGLRNAWRTRPTRVSAREPAVPDALDTLVMSLLSLNPTGRPQHAAEVIDKLTAIGELSPEHDLGVMRAYLTTPELVGRDAELLRIRKAIVRATRGRGSAFLVRADPGAGSSRLIDVAVLEAQLAGALVARAASDTRRDDGFGAVRSVAEQWSSGLPSVVATQLRADISAATTDATATTDAREETTRVHERLAEALLRAARQYTLMLAIDDMHQIDVPSAAVFALVAKLCPDHRLFVFGSLPAAYEHGGSIPLRMLVDNTRAITLSTWALDETEALLKSVFGQVAHVSLLAHRIHQIALGNPLHTLQLAQHLVDIDVIRHAAGAWVLPSTLDELALPQTMTEAQRQLVANLAPDDQRLAATLALAPNLPQLSLLDLSELAADTLARLDRLTQLGVLIQHGQGVAFRHQSITDALVEKLSPDERQQLHRELVRMHTAREHHVLTVAYHLDRADDPHACFETVGPWLESDQYRHYEAHQVALVSTMVEDEERYPIGIRHRHKLRGLLAQYACVYDPGYGHHGEASFEQLRTDTGLVHWDEFALPDSERILACIQRAQELYEATPETHRGFSPVEAIRELAILVRSLTSVYARTLDSAKILGLGQWLKPFQTLVPIMGLLYQLTETTAGRAVHERRVADQFKQHAIRFSEPMDGVDDESRGNAAAICTYCAAMDAAKQGKPAALTMVDPVEKEEGFAALAWHVRMLSHLYCGRTAEAADCRQRMELLVIQQDQPNTLLAMSVLYEAWGYEMCEDLTGLKGALEQVEQEANLYPGWRPWAALYGGDVHRLRGDVETALAEYERTEAMTGAGKHQAWPHAIERRLGALRLLGRFDEALNVGRAGVAYAEAEDLEPVNMLRIYIGLALVEGNMGLFEDAGRTMDRALSCVQREEIGGIPRGIVHEAEARIAIWAHDLVAYTHASKQCADYLLAGDNPALTAKYDRLVMESIAADLGPEPRVRRVDAQLPQAVQELQEVQDPAERSAMVLGYLAEHYKSDASCLFGVTPQGPVLLTSAGDVDAERLAPMVAEYLEAELTATELLAVPQGDQQTAVVDTGLWALPSGDRYTPVLLPAEEGPDELIVAVAVLHVESSEHVFPSHRLLHALGKSILSDGQVVGIPVAS